MAHAASSSAHSLYEGRVGISTLGHAKAVVCTRLHGGGGGAAHWLMPYTGSHHRHGHVHVMHSLVVV